MYINKDMVECRVKEQGECGLDNKVKK
jgi:hypothetical protein